METTLGLCIVRYFIHTWSQQFYLKWSVPKHLMLSFYTPTAFSIHFAQLIWSEVCNLCVQKILQTNDSSKHCTSYRLTLLNKNRETVLLYFYRLATARCIWWILWHIHLENILVTILLCCLQLSKLSLFNMCKSIFMCFLWFIFIMDTNNCIIVTVTFPPFACFLWTYMCI